MVDADMAADLESFGKPLVVIGDPMQLPPPEGAGYYIKDQPDILLTEVHSTAPDNPIVGTATKARLGEPIAQGSYGKSLVVHKRDLKLVDWMHCDQVICGTNVSRHATNTYWRQNLGLDIAANPLPLWGERVVCLKNSRQHDLWNGTTHTVAADSRRLRDSPDMMFLTLNDQDPQAGDRLLEAWTFPFLDGRNVEQWRKGAVWFDYGYALTAHKAQGSRWPKVGIKCDWAWKASQAQWLYTAITRASDRVLIVQGCDRPPQRCRCGGQINACANPLRSTPRPALPCLSTPILCTIKLGQSSPCLAPPRPCPATPLRKLIRLIPSLPCHALPCPSVSQSKLSHSTPLHSTPGPSLPCHASPLRTSTRPLRSTPLRALPFLAPPLRTPTRPLHASPCQSTPFLSFSQSN